MVHLYLQRESSGRLGAAAKSDENEKLTWAEFPLYPELLLYRHFHLLQLLECSGPRSEQEPQIQSEKQE